MENKGVDKDVYLAIKGVACTDPSVSPRNKAKINNINQPIVKDDGKFFGDKVSTVRTQAFIVKI